MFDDFLTNFFSDGPGELQYYAGETYFGKSTQKYNPQPFHLKYIPNFQN